MMMCYIDMCMYIYTVYIRGTVAQVLALPPHSKKVMVSILALGRCWLWLGGRSSPDLQCSGGAISRAFLCGVCMFSPCSQGVSSTKKTCKRTEHSSSVPDQDRRFISPGPRALKKKSCLLLLASWREGSPRWYKCRS